jgi:ribonuclease-3
MAASLEQILGYEFKDKNLLEMALTHKSYANESQSSDNERLEFLGDAVVNLVVGDELMKAFSDDREGSLSKNRARLVSEDGLRQVAVVLNLADYLKLGKGEIINGASANPRLLSSTYEALVGALYLDAGFEVTQRITREHFAPLVERLMSGDHFGLDHKTRLQERLQSINRVLPAYEVISEEGPSHDKKFKVQVKMSGVVIGEGLGRSKKQAEQEAARSALEAMARI